MQFINGKSTASQPLIVTPEDMSKVLDDKETLGAVYKPTTDEVQFKQNVQSVALSKEELERYVNDPCWRKIRYGCVILFWLSWILMFVIAIGIVVMSPKCPSKPNREWWEKKICYQIWTRSFKDSNGDGVGDFKGVSEKLSLLSSSLKTSAIWPIPILKSLSGSGYDVLDYKDVDSTLGTVEDFEQLIKDVHNYKMHLIMDIPLAVVSTSHDWFQKSIGNNSDYGQYFIWKDTIQPNEAKDFMKHDNGKFYRSWGGRKTYALLNWNHEPVRAALKDVVKFWLDRGVDGFYLGEVQFMSTKPNGEPDWDVIHAYLKNFTAYIKETAGNRQIMTFTSAGYKYEEKEYGIKIEELKTNLKFNADVDYVIHNELVNAGNSCRAHCFYDHLNNVVKMHNNYNLTSWPMWEIGHPYVSRIASRLDSRNRADMALMLLMTLPGSVNVLYGDEIGMIDTDAPTVKKLDRPRAAMQWTADSNGGASDAAQMAIPVHSDHVSVNYKVQSSGESTLKMFKRLVGLRRSEDAFLYGDILLGPKNENLLTFLMSSNQSISKTDYLTVLNFGVGDVFNLMDLSSPNFVSGLSGKDAVVVSMTTKLALAGAYKNRQTVDLMQLNLGFDEGVVIRLRNKQ